MSPEAKQKWLDSSCLTLLALLILVFPLGQTTVWNVDESRFAEGAKEMVRSGDFIIPRNLGDPVVFYPPLMYWLIAWSSLLFGGFTETSVRLPSALAGWGCVLLTYFLGRLLSGRRLGLLAGIILVTTAGFVTIGQICQADMVLTFFILLAMTFFLNFYFGGCGKPVLLVGFYVSMGLAALTKGPQGIVVPMMIVVLFLLLAARDLKKLGRFKPFWGALIVVGIVAPWLYLAWQKGGGSFIQGFYHENLHMFAGGKMLIHKAGPFYYLLALAEHALPWLLFFLSGLGLLCMGRRDEENRSRKRLLVLWFFAILIFYSISAAKRPYYLLPLYPAFALTAAVVWIKLPEPGQSGWRRLLWGAPFFLLILTGVIALVVILFFSHRLRAEVQPTVSTMAPLLAVWIIFSVAATVAFFKKKERLAFAGVALPLVAALAWYGLYGLHAMDQDGRNGVSFCKKIDQLRPGDAFYLYHVRPAVAFYLESPFRVASREGLIRDAGTYGRSMAVVISEDVFRRDELLEQYFTVVDRVDVHGGNLLLCRAR